MKLDLCKIFGVKEEQHFWIKRYTEANKSEIREYYIKNKELYEVFETNDFRILGYFNIVDNKEIYYTKPVDLTDNTRQFLKMINKDYKYITRDGFGELKIFKNRPIKDTDDLRWKVCDMVEYNSIADTWFDIDLLFISWNDEEPTLISDLLGDEK